MRTSDIFTVSGPLPPDSQTYVERLADEELFQLALASQFSYVLAAHHMGKSSLMVRTAWRLQQQGVSTATVDLDGIGPDVRLEQAYLFLIKRLKFQLKLSIEPDIWWAERASADPVRRFTDFIHDVLLAGVEGPIVIFVDGINNTTSNSGFFDGFFAAIRSIYNARATDCAYNRLTFVLLGMAPLADLIKNHNQTPFTGGQKIDLGEFSREEARVLQQSLQATCAEQADPIFTRIFYWTNGHPYLTQKLCSTVVKMWDRHWNDERVDGLVERLFLSTMAHSEPNLQLVKGNIKASPWRRRLLSLYRRVHEGKKVPADEQSLDQHRLKLFGLVRAENGTLKLRNRVYRSAFDRNWVKANMPVNWIRYVAIILTLLTLILVGGFSFSIRQQNQRATQAQAFIDGFRSTTSSEERLISLAGLFNLYSHEDQARRLFYEELSPADQLALFDLADPPAVGEPLITVVKGIYTDPDLENNRHNNALLGAMAAPLNQLGYSPSLGAIELELEITQWLKGREYYQAQNQNRQTIDAYNVAIGMNDRNPGPYFDRGLAYAAQNEPSRAVADFATVLSLDESWQARVQQALLSHSQIYTALWGEKSEYRTLIALVPTPTSTPTPTASPTPSPTPTSTNTPPPPTSTPTNAPAATPTATPTPTPGLPTSTPIATSTPTPGVPTGTFTLLSPLSVDDPSYGPTDFEWQWTGAVPPGFGFEVRVWREGEQPAGAHNAVLDSQNGDIKSIGGNRYRFSTNIANAAGVQGQGGIYLWSVALVQISPNYADLGQQAEPAHLRIEIGSGRSGSDKDDGDGGGGVGID